MHVDLSIASCNKLTLISGPFYMHMAAFCAQQADAHARRSFTVRVDGDKSRYGRRHKLRWRCGRAAFVRANAGDHDACANDISGPFAKTPAFRRNMKHRNP